MISEHSDQGPGKPKMPQVLSSDEFLKTLGQITWLMTVSKLHRGKPASWIETQICAPLMFRQVRVFVKEKQPLAALSWAYASQEVLDRLQRGERAMTLQDWRSGPEVCVVECISPLGESQLFIDRFLAEAAATEDSKNSDVQGSDI